MDNYLDQFEIEKAHLTRIKKVIEKQIIDEKEARDNKRNKLISARKDMYENTIHSSKDFDKLSDAVQFLNPIEVQTHDYQAAQARIQKLEKMIAVPYFARIDFREEGQDTESIYIGLGNLTDDRTRQIYICDWRAPISSIFYRYGLGKSSYKAPYGIITGEVTLKRQFEIKNCELQYFFDSSVTIIDDILKQTLSRNTSSKMKSIVETIQKEQDIIIRDMENDLLIVQGVAGSGKTSVALHRVAYLMYHGAAENLSFNNIVLITPNNIFEKYIDNVLPELGEKNIQTVTLEDLFENILFEEKVKAKSRNSLFEEIIMERDINKKQLIKSSMEFLLSGDFITILDRYLKYFEHKVLEFRDIFYNGGCIASRHLIKAELLRQNDIALPLEKRLETIENRIMLKIHEMRKSRIDKLERFIANYPEHIYEVKPLARLLSIKENRALKNEVYRFTRIDARKMLMDLIKNRPLFYRIAKGLHLPENIQEILEHTRNNLEEPVIRYDSAMVLLCLKLKMAGCDLYKDIRQVVVDEAQDYYPLQYEILKKSFTNAKYTIMGDINQTIGKQADLSFLDEIKSIMEKKRSWTVLMTKSFRCSYEINKFSLLFADKNVEIESFKRYETIPAIVRADDQTHMEKSIVDDVKKFREQGYESIAIICKSMSDSLHLFQKIGKKVGAEFLNSDTFDSSKQVIILPVYMAKGLEFDAVLIYQTNDENYSSKDDKKLLYICCTRALHRLSLYYTGKISRLIPKDEEERA